MINYISIRQFILENPNEKKFKVFRVFDGYVFTVKEVLENTVILNTKVNIEISQDDDSFKVHESMFGLDYSLPKIFDYSPDSLDKPVYSLNFRKELTGRLHSEKYWAYGRLLMECFHPFSEDLRTVDYTDLILKITNDYEFDPQTREVVYRMQMIKWMNHLGEVVNEKPQPKIYTGPEGMKEAETRRSNIVHVLKHDLDKLSKGSGSVELIQATQALIGAIDPYINLYIKYGSFAIIDFLNASQNALLFSEIAPSYTVKMYMVSKIDFRTPEATNPNLYKGSQL